MLADAMARFERAGVPSPRVDAELLLAHVLGIPRNRLVTAPAPKAAQVTVFEAALRRRLAREPLQHITGTAQFRNIEVAVGPGVFVPRPETELLVDAVLPVLRGAERPVAVDLCSGSGALALAMAVEVPDARVFAVETSAAALEWLERNTTGTRVEVTAADVTAGDVLRSLRGRADAVVCNPPYVPTAADVAPEVRHDPEEAVFAGESGLTVMPYVIARAAELLRPGGVLALEHDETQGTAVPELLKADGRWAEVIDHPDLTGRPRYATAIRT